ncbi:uncharacterized protein J3D65DRAFT_160839 [Phyllosticta citribraziliensis]|uniref:BTB domain-containing protein n=1 Tax=Phyllosticta citribraziliensis TaxID=989973 RepID=A0ABR1L3R2_9PEZI
MATPKPEDMSEEVQAVAATNAFDPEQMDERRLSDHLSTQIIEIVVGTSRRRTFYIHESLLCHASEKLSVQLRGPFKEAQTGKIADCEEDPSLYAFFADYLYHDGWLRDPSKIEDDVEWVLLARLYAMGERLGAKVFQNACLWRFWHSITRYSDIGDSEICQLLATTTELPERSNKDDDPLRSLVLWYTASRISSLRNSQEFKDLIFTDHPELGSQILMWVADNKENHDPVCVTRPSERFIDEVEYIY